MHVESAMDLRWLRLEPCGPSPTHCLYNLLGIPVPDEFSLFDLGEPPIPAATSPMMITPDQRNAIRNAFQRLGVTDAREQFDIVYQLTGQRVRSPNELESRHAHALISRLVDRIRTQGVERTGNAWDDREEDTWIDKL